MNKINGGYFLISRKIWDSEINLKNERYFKIWIYLLSEVNFYDKGLVKRGSGHFNFTQMAAAINVSYGSIEKCIKWLKMAGQIATEKSTHGMKVTILNYDSYQNKENYLSTETSIDSSKLLRHGRHFLSTPNIEECNNGKKYIKALYCASAQPKFVKPTAEEIKAACMEKGYNIDADLFIAHYEANGWRVGRNPMKSWRAALVTWSKNGISPQVCKTCGGKRYIIQHGTHCTQEVRCPDCK